MKLFYTLVLLLSSLVALSKDFYIRTSFQNVYESSRMIKPIDIMSCGEKVLVEEGGAQLVRIKKGSKQFYIPSRSISPSKPTCFQQIYSEFFLQLNLSYKDLYYWAKLEEVMANEKK